MTTAEQIPPPSGGGEIEVTRTPQVIQSEYTTKLVQQSNNTAYNNLAKLISTNEYTDERGITYKSRMLTHKEIGKIKKLTRDADDIDQDKDWDKYIDNLRQQGKLLIQDLTDEQFDTADWYIMENLIVAWRMKPRGFRSL